MTATHRRMFFWAFLLFFYGLAWYKWQEGQWFYQIDPTIFFPRFDGISWLFMQTGFHKALIEYPFLRILMDVLFYGFPLGFGVAAWTWPENTRFLAWVWLLVNWVYVQFYCLFPTNSIEAHIVWLLFPLLFAMRSLSNYYFVLQGLRYYFLYFFFSAAIWKLVAGGAFEPLQMSGILLEQHKEWLLYAGDEWQARLIIFLIEWPVAGLLLYWLALLAELSFGLGFITRKYDKMLIVFFTGFLFFDYLIMRIPYFEVSPFLLTLWFSRHEPPVKAEKGVVTEIPLQPVMETLPETETTPPEGL